MISALGAPSGKAFGSQVRPWILTAILWIVISSRIRAEDFVDSRYQFYQEDDDRIRVDSTYSLFHLDLSDTLKLTGSYLYSAISGASPSGLPPFRKGPLPLVELTDERNAFTLNLTKQLGPHAISGGFAYSTESDYVSLAYSVQDTFTFNDKNTSLTAGFAFTDDTVGANGTNLHAPRRSYDLILGVNQILSPDDLLTANLVFTWRQGFLNDPYKRVLINRFFVLPDQRPNKQFSQLFYVQWTHYITPWDASVETTYRFGNNDWDSNSHTMEFAAYKKFFGGRLVVGPSVRFYFQTEAFFYNTEFFGNPKYHSADYRVSSEETINLGIQLRYFLLEERLAIDAGYERYLAHGLDQKTPEETYPDANSFSIGLHYQF